MSDVTLQFVRHAGIASSAIAWFTQGEFSHTEAVLADGSLLGSYESKVGDIPTGVQIRPADYAKWTRQVRFTLPCTEHSQTVWEAFLRSQIGKPYDWDVIAGFVTGRNWRDHSSWICSEIQAAALEAAWICAPLYLATPKISPNAMALVASALPGVKREDLI